ncbi:Vesicle-trafficking protein SEC22b [Trichinella nativa]|uniref:Vesicle-trafficking protein SEC22b n=3 Tax=Trichinella TaxID=6333 RepID=A0A0V1KRB3_9BILA|nr:Vesicle-trafficking protein SEC22b [Trichinella murrelli]KRX61406.1 Vesicle-trafficking protein SEC22b [Trichinella sp. T9]KRX75383.1 Vesicle-trafficking protein SEC22b [Trichinella sp. T6]KRY09660.1 Vesicle-trafficking protein SEC22b [Trichinella patagoniensis]KRZ49834.1 Vesicle-trafficking protein SEC22b [Trichinella nativa]KRZ85634.1 Vesicle-trafficking protein SEC22b [Trichinella sp. T8]
MIHMTLIARVRDGLPLATSIEGDEQSDIGISKFTSQAKMLFRKLNDQSPKQCSLETGNYYFHYIIDKNVCYLCLCDAAMSRNIAFAYLEELAREFCAGNAGRIESVTRPYHFIEFDSVIQNVKRKYVDYRNRHHLSAVHTELQDVQRIMVQNIEEVIHRGEALNILDDKAANLAFMSQKYKKDAHILNSRSSILKLGVVTFAIVFILFIFKLYFF